MSSRCSNIDKGNPHKPSHNKRKINRKYMCDVYRRYLLKNPEECDINLYWDTQKKINKHLIKKVGNQSKTNKKPKDSQEELKITILIGDKTQENKDPKGNNKEKGDGTNKDKMKEPTEDKKKGQVKQLGTLEEEFKNFSGKFGGLNKAEFKTLYNAIKSLTGELKTLDKTVKNPLASKWSQKFLEYVAAYVRVVALEAIRQGNMTIEKLLIQAIPVIIELLRGITSDDSKTVISSTARLTTIMVDFTVAFVKDIYREDAEVPGLVVVYGAPSTISVSFAIASIAAGLVTTMVKFIKENPPDLKKVKPLTLLIQLFAPAKFGEEIAKMQAVGKKNDEAEEQEVTVSSSVSNPWYCHITPHNGELAPKTPHPDPERHYIGVFVGRGEKQLKFKSKRFRYLNNVFEIRLLLVERVKSGKRFIKYQITEFIPRTSSRLLSSINKLFSPNSQSPFSRRAGWRTKTRNGTIPWDRYRERMVELRVLKINKMGRYRTRIRWNNDRDLMEKLLRKTQYPIRNRLVLISYTLLSRDN